MYYCNVLLLGFFKGVRRGGVGGVGGEHMA